MDEENKNLRDEVEENIVIETSDEEFVDEPSDIDINIDNVEELNEEESLILASKIEVEIQKYEDILLQGEKEFLDDEELKKLGFDLDEYNRLKRLDKEIYKHVKTMHKASEGKNVFSYFPVWLAIIGAIVLVFNVYPVNPLLFVKVIINLSDYFAEAFNGGGAVAAYISYFIYIGIFYLPLIVGFIIILIKAILNKSYRKTLYWYIFVLVLDILILIPGLISFIKIVSRI